MKYQARVYKGRTTNVLAIVDLDVSFTPSRGMLFSYLEAVLGIRFRGDGITGNYWWSVSPLVDKPRSSSASAPAPGPA